MTLAEFLLARIAEDEAVARTAAAGPWTTETWDRMIPASRAGHTIRSATGQWVVAPGHDDGGVIGAGNAAHIARHDPARVLAECAAKRAIVELHTGHHECVGDRHGRRGTVLVAEGYIHANDPTLRLLALPYAAHADYRPEWTPAG